MSSVTAASAWHLALVGTPNSGKTALFNALTGSRQKVANYPGVTVERKSGVLQTPSGRRVHLIDLPGTYSLRGRSPDEEITRDVVLGRLVSETGPDLLLCVAVGMPARPDTVSARVDAVLLHPVAGLLILLGVLFVMFQAVFAWAKPVMDVISSGFDTLGAAAQDALPAGLLQSFIQNGVIA